MRRGWVVVVLTVAALTGPVVGVALAGGGCHLGATQADERGSDRVTIELKDACFTPSILQVDPGTTVTFVNRDPFVHNVGGTAWGHFDTLLQGNRFAATFDESGVYPFACSIHPGMTGAIVVGDGSGAGNGSMVTAASTVDPPASPPARASSGYSWLPVALGGALIGGIAGMAVARTRRPVPAV